MAAFNEGEEDGIYDSSNDNIWIAASNGDIERVKELLQSGISINNQDETGYSPIHAAVSYSQIDLIHFLHQNGANLEIRDEDGDTPLLVAEQADVYELLIQLGADPNVRNQNGEGIVEKVLDDDNLDMITYFVEKGLLDENVVLAKYQVNGEEMEGIEEGEGEDEDEEDDGEDEEGGEEEKGVNE